MQIQYPTYTDPPPLGIPCAPGAGARRTAATARKAMQIQYLTSRKRFYSSSGSVSPIRHEIASTAPASPRPSV